MELTECLKALGEPMRMAIFQQILARRHCTRSLSMKLGITESAVSQHIKVLRDAGLVYSVKYGFHTHHLPAQVALDFLAASIEEMRRASQALDRDGIACQCEFRQQREGRIQFEIREKETGVMRIAVTYEGGQVFQHFGYTEQFKLYDVADGAVRSSQVVSAEGFGHGALADFLRQCKVDALICGGIGGGAQAALADAGIRFYAGVQGDADTAAAGLIAGKLNYVENPVCDRHGEHSGGDCGRDGTCCQ